MEPALECTAALHVPSTGIVDTHQLALSLSAGTEVALRTRVADSERLPCGRYRLTLSCGATVDADRVVNSAGIGAHALARSRGVPAAPQVVAKGCYFAVSGAAQPPFSRLVYPVPEPGGLGVHLTLDLAGRARFGPNVTWVPFPGDYTVPADLAPLFEAEVRKYWPGLRSGTLSPGYAGVRAKAVGKADPSADFLIACDEDQDKSPRWIDLVGIESPGITSSLAIAEHVASIFNH